MLAMILLTGMLFLLWLGGGVFWALADADQRGVVEIMVMLPVVIVTTLFAVGWLAVIIGWVISIWRT